MLLMIEKMPYAEALEVEPLLSPVPLGAGAPSLANWRTGLPLLHGSVVTLRELRHEDAAALFSALASHEANRYLSPPPSTVEGFACFIAWSVRQREAGQYAVQAINWLFGHGKPGLKVFGSRPLMTDRLVI